MNPLAFILHHANRFSKEPGFYAIKDRILTKHGKDDDYDIQHIPGKKCRSCGGTGVHYYYGNSWPFKAYDSTDCWHCNGGWYKLPQWICLQRKKFGGYVFHKPLKREFMSRNPWTTEGMGFEVSSRPIIEGYIEHDSAWFGRLAVLILYLIYDRHEAKIFWRKEITFWYFVPMFIKRIKWRVERWNWQRNHPQQNYLHYTEEEFEELPF